MTFVVFNDNPQPFSAENLVILPKQVLGEAQAALEISNLLLRAGWQRKLGSEWISDEILPGFTWPLTVRSGIAVAGFRFFCQIQPDPAPANNVILKASHLEDFSVASANYPIPVTSPVSDYIYGVADSSYAIFWIQANGAGQSVFLGRHVKAESDPWAWSIQYLLPGRAGNILRLWNAPTFWPLQPVNNSSSNLVYYAMTYNLLLHGSSSALGDPSEGNTRRLSPWIPPYEVGVNRGQLSGVWDGLIGFPPGSVYPVDEGNSVVGVYLVLSHGAAIRYGQFSA